MNEMNRYVIVLTAAAVIVAMVIVVFLTWAAPQETVDALIDSAEFLDDNNDTAGQALVTLGALALAILALLWIVVELAPDDEVKDLRVEQAGATTIVPAEALRLRLEESLLALGGVTAARTKVWPRDKGVAVGIDLTVVQTANVGDVTQRAMRSVVDTLHEDLGLPVSGTPEVRIAFGGSRAADGAGAAVSSPPPAAEPPPTEPRPEPEMPPPPAPSEEPPPYAGPPQPLHETTGAESPPAGEERPGEPPPPSEDRPGDQPPPQ